MFTVKQAAHELGVSPTLVYAMCAARRLRHYRVGLGRGKIVIPEDAVEEYLEARTVGPGTPKKAAAPEPTSGPFKMLDGERLAAAWEGRS